MTLETVFYVLGIVFMLSYLAALAVVIRLIIKIAQELESTRDKIDSTLTSVEVIMDKLYRPKLLGVAGVIVPMVMAFWKNKKRSR